MYKFCCYLLLISVFTAKHTNVEGTYHSTLLLAHMGFKTKLTLTPQNNYKKTIYFNFRFGNQKKSSKRVIKGKWKIENNEVLLIPVKCKKDDCVTDTLLIVNENQLNQKNSNVFYTKE